MWPNLGLKITLNSETTVTIMITKIPAELNNNNATFWDF